MSCVHSVCVCRMYACMFCYFYFSMCCHQLQLILRSKLTEAQCLWKQVPWISFNAFPSYGFLCVLCFFCSLIERTQLIIIQHRRRGRTDDWKCFQIMEDNGFTPLCFCCHSCLCGRCGFVHSITQIYLCSCYFCSARLTRYGKEHGYSITIFPVTHSAKENPSEKKAQISNETSTAKSKLDTAYSILL